MRVLIAVLALGGCYSPAIDDCQFRCGSGMDCPAGTDCIGGVCRTTATGSCPAITDAGNPCPLAPQPPANCSLKFSLENNGCGVFCGSGGGGSERTAVGAAMACTSGAWQLAILDTIAKLDAIPQMSEVHWVGAARPPLQNFQWLNGDPVIAASWAGGQEPLSGNDCAVVTSARRLVNTVNCGDTEPYICTWPVR